MPLGSTYRSFFPLFITLLLMFSKHLAVANDESHLGVALYRDVGYGLRRTHSQRKRTFRLPIVYSNPLADFNTWDNMFMERLMGSITIHKPVTVPAAVLTLGNGFDFWAIHAARVWPECHITAHGLLGMRKDNMDALLRSMNLADRVTYLRGDPSRELRLNYPRNTFDMVRLSYCSLNLAETEWYVFLQEVNRVLKPGGVLEVIDEDLLFPGHKSPNPGFETSSPPAQQYHFQLDIVPPLSSVYDSRSMRTADAYSLDVKTITSSSPLKSMHSDSQRDWNRSEISLSSSQYAVDPLDHSKLTRAWHEMLTSRWISASITSVLPFYLSAIFENLRALPALEVFTVPSPAVHPFPPDQAPHQQMIDPEPFRHLAHATVKDDADSPVTWLPASEAPPHFIPSYAPMHLARMVAIVGSCKEAIWGAYNKLYSNDLRLPRLHAEPGKTSVRTVREEFEYHWLNWECDMRSRIDMGSAAEASLRWVHSSPRDPSDSDRARWLKSVAHHAQAENVFVGSASPQPVKREVTRCVRGFVARKFSEAVPETALNSGSRPRTAGAGGNGHPTPLAQAYISSI